MPRNPTPPARRTPRKSRTNTAAPSSPCAVCGRGNDPAQEMIEMKLAIERAKLQKIKNDTRNWPPKYIKYEDMPPPSPEERAQVIARVLEMAERFRAQAAAEKREWYLGLTHLAP